MTETTTIQVRKDQAQELKEIARENGNYKTVIDRLLEGYNETTTNESVRSGDEVMQALETIEQRTGRLERQLEELGRS